jgi:spore germination protein YaaH
MKLLGITSVGFDVTDQLLIRSFNDTVHQLFVNIKKEYDSVRREILYNIVIRFGVPTKQVRSINMSLNETYS